MLPRIAFSDTKTSEAFQDHRIHFRADSKVLPRIAFSDTEDFELTLNLLKSHTQRPQNAAQDSIF